MTATSIAAVRLEERQPQSKKKLSHDIEIGKDILELVSGAMYIEPLTIVREYVQNAVDSIDEADTAGLYSNKEKPRVEIIVDITERKLRIRDNGVGVDRASFTRRLTAFGASKKRATRARGFRGVGRLSGLGYCQELTFRSRSARDSEVLELTWDGRRFKEILLDPQYKGGLNEVVREVTTLTTCPGTGYPKHFFEVELLQPIRQKNDVLLNEHEIEQYLAQVAPVPFHPDFEFGKEINRYLKKFEIGRSYDIVISSTAAKDAEPKKIYRPYRNRFRVFGGNKDRFVGVDFLELTGVDGNLAAVGWVLDHSYYGAVPKSEGVKGLRLRSGNIQVGPDDIMADVFPEPRFSSWTVGEIHVIAPKLLPNGRRDAFEANTHYLNLQGHVAAYAKKITKLCRDKSKARNQERRFNFERKKVEEKIMLVSRSSIPRALKGKLRREVTAHVKTLEKLILPIGNPTTKKRFEQVLVQIKIRAGRNLDHAALKDPLARLPMAEQKLYQKVIGLVFECSPNQNVARAMVERILTRLIR